MQIRRWLSPIELWLVLCLVSSCGGRTDCDSGGMADAGGTQSTSTTSSFGGSSAGFGGTLATGGLTAQGGEAGADGPSEVPFCGADGYRLVVLSNDQNLYRVVVPSLETQWVGTVDCGSELTSLAVRVTGEAYACSLDGELFRVNIRTGACTRTSFKPDQAANQYFGMGFGSGDEPGSEVLRMVSNRIFSTSIAVINLTDFTLKDVVQLTPPIGNFDILGDENGNVYLFGNDVNNTPGLYGVDPKTGAWWVVARFWTGYTFSFYDFARMNGVLYFFAGGASPLVESTVTRRAGNESPVLLGRIPMLVVGAGSESCADTTAR